ncbi:hypothetical protein [Thermophilibacter provencensis]|uniref:Uncharacterized protein n=1 Tax=Thermophilibacter provencensis TaxID=1852386 RepID=A0ABT7V3Z2_9ACTN|nr:hypothetical protein [Thermophilibacter provencensis]MDM8271315.1 hypothetical protein [Thermophilibacter provencensis]
MTKTRRYIRLPETPNDAVDTLERFVTRARRIEAHSLVKSRKVEEFARQNYTLLFNGSSTLLRLNSRPEDEEVFESLAARIRPCIVDSEPIQLEKVVAAIRILTKDAELNEQQVELLDEIDTWYENHIAPNSHAAIATQEEIEQLDSGEIASATDTLLGLGWYYADLVHSDPKQEKEVVLRFPYNTRYNRGVFLVSLLATKVCSLLNLIREIDSSHNLGLSPEIWTSQVVAGGGPCELGIGIAYVGPAGSIPAQGISMDKMPEFKKLNVVIARRIQCPACAVDALLIDASGEVFDTYEGFYAFDKEQNSVVININDEILLEGKPENSTIPINKLSFEQAFSEKTVKPVNGEMERLANFLEKAATAERVDITLMWNGTPIRETIAFPAVSPIVDSSELENSE